MQCGYPYAPGSELNAQMSIRYCIAIALLDGAALPPQFTPERIADPAVTKLAQAIEVSHDPAQDKLYPGRYAAWVEIENAPKSNTFERNERLDPSGHPSNPARDRTLMEKYHRLSVPVLGQGPADKLAAALTAIERTDAKTLVHLLALPK